MTWMKCSGGSTRSGTGEDEDEVFYKASNLLLHEFRKISGEFVAIGLVKISFPVEEIFTVELRESIPA